LERGARRARKLELKQLPARAFSGSPVRIYFSAQYTTEFLIIRRPEGLARHSLMKELTLSSSLGVWPGLEERFSVSGDQ
jgi:hypothetical protein